MQVEALVAVVDSRRWGRRSDETQVEARIPRHAEGHQHMASRISGQHGKAIRPARGRRVATVDGLLASRNRCHRGQREGGQTPIQTSSHKRLQPMSVQDPCRLRGWAGRAGAPA